MSITVESVLPAHPDKTCDAVADRLLDEYLKQDPNSRVAIEVFGTGDKLVIGGEVTSQGKIKDFDTIVQEVLYSCGASPINEIFNFIHEQSPEINKLSHEGAGDSGIVYGYATAETENMMPPLINKVHAIARNYFEQFGGDGKVQLTQHDNGEVTEVSKIQGRDFTKGSFAADTGLTGRKTQVDTYCGLVQHGGGSFSGKDATKIDRSGAYMARWLAKHIVAKKDWPIDEVIISLAYEIGKLQPVMLEVRGNLFHEHRGFDTFIKDYIQANFDLSPQAIIKKFGLDKPIYSQYSCYGHFGRLDAPWEKEY